MLGSQVCSVCVCVLAGCIEEALKANPYIQSFRKYFLKNQYVQAAGVQGVLQFIQVLPPTCSASGFAADAALATADLVLMLLSDFLSTFNADPLPKPDRLAKRDCQASPWEDWTRSLSILQP